MKPINYILTGFLCLCINFLQAQTPIVTSFTASTTTAAINATVDIQLKVTNFNNIEVFQIPIGYNAALLQFLSADAFGLPGMAGGNVANPLLPVPRITVAYFSDAVNYPNGVTLPAGTSVMTLHFKVLANGTSTVNINPLLPPGVDVVNKQGQSVAVNHQNGGVSITGGNGQTAVVGFKLMATPDTVNTGDTVCMPVRVNDFDNILGMQYAMHWDKTVLQYVRVQNFNLPGLSGGGFGVYPTTGTITTQWDDPNATGVTRPDMASIYEVCFKAIGGHNSTSSQYFDAVGLPAGSATVEIVNGAGVNVWDTQHSSVPATILLRNTDGLRFYADTMTINKDSTRCLSVKVRKFTNIEGAQFGITYDASKLQFVNFGLGANPLSLSVGSSISHPSAGQVRMVWTDPNGTSTTVADGTTIFSMCFKPTSGVGMTVPIVFTDIPPDIIIEAIQLQNGVSTEVLPFMVNGHIYITNFVPPVPPVVALDSIRAVKCNGGATGAIFITATGTGLSYSWTGPNNFTSTQGDINNLKAGTYNLTVNSTNGTNTVRSYMVSEPAALSMPAQSITNVKCFGGNDGAITTAMAGGTVPYRYNWSGPGGFTSTAQSVSNLVAGTYRVTVSDKNDCTFTTGAIQVAQPSAIAIPTGQTSVTTVKCMGGNDGAINIAITGGTGPFSIMWTGPNNFTATTEDLTNLSAGNYTPKVTDANNCVFNGQAITVTQPNSAPNPSLVSTTDIKCFGDANGAVAINMTGGTTPYTFQWMKNNSPFSTTEDPNNLTAGVYTLVVRDNNQCSASLPNPVTISGPSATLGATETHTNVSCLGQNNGSISLNIFGGWAGNKTVTWTPVLPSGPNPTGLLAGTYTPLITDAGNCSLTMPPITITTISTPISYASQNVQQVKCKGQGDGSIAISLTGGVSPYTVIWTGGLAGTTISNLSGGSYTPMVTDNLGCTATLPTIMVPEPTTALTIAGNPTIQPQSGVSPNGSINISVSGGTPSYSFLWSPGGATQEDPSGLAAGQYNVTITDANQCSSVGGPYFIGQTNLLTPQLVSTTGSCNNNGCLTIYVPPTGVTKPYTFRWSNNPNHTYIHNGTQDSVTICGISGGNYIVTVVDASNNTAMVGGVSIPSFPPITPLTTISAPFDDNEDGYIVLVPPGGANYNYLWNIGIANDTLTALDSGLYVVTITDANTGCSASFSYHLPRRYEKITTLSNIQRPSCPGTESGQICLTVNGGNAPYEFSWSGPSIVPTDTADCVSQLAAGQYRVTVTDENGTDSIYVFQLNTISNLQATALVETAAAFNGYDVSSPTNCDGIVRANPIGQLDPLNYNWSNGVTTRRNTEACAGSWSVTVTDAAGCSVVLEGELTTPPSIAVSGSGITDYNGFHVSCKGKNDGVARVSALGGIVPYMVEWNTGFADVIQTTTGYSQQTNLPAGTYTVTVTDANNIETIFDFPITEPDSLVLDFLVTAPNRFTVCDGTVLATAINAAGTVSYTWSSTYGSGTGGNAEELCAGEEIQYLARDENGCTVNGKTLVPYPSDGCLQVRPVLTPGQTKDKNDFLLITCVESIPDNKLEIFNRWGQLVFETEAYHNSSNNWTGTNQKGLDLPEGVYFYVLTYTNAVGEPTQLKGYVNLLK